MEFSKETIINLFEMAFDKLFDNDMYLLQTQVNERCVMARVAMYIEQQLRTVGEKDLNVDIEYNRHIENPKRNCNGGIYIPDLVIHQRGTDERNICCCEAKKNAEEDDNQDYIKIKNQMGDLGYQYGIVIRKMQPFEIEYILVYHNEEELHKYSPNH